MGQSIEITLLESRRSNFQWPKGSITSTQDPDPTIENDTELGTHIILVSEEILHLLKVMSDAILMVQCNYCCNAAIDEKRHNKKTQDRAENNQ